MNAYVTDFSDRNAVPASRVECFILNNDFEHPTPVIDTDVVARQYSALSAGLGRASIHYAVKANPAKEIIETLVRLGSHFDAASRGEIELCLGQGAAASDISFGNTIKKARDIAWAHGVGITLFSADAEEELENIATHAPGAQVYIRLIVDASEADWPLSCKFGCARDKVIALLQMARDLGLAPVGFSFHVGSQTRRADMWAITLDQLAAVWDEAKEAGFDLTLLNIGGGFPAFYGEAIDAPTAYAANVMRQIDARFGEVAHILAGPSCDSADVLYERRPVELPMGLRSGDKVIIRNCGAYTSTYSSAGFNGFPPLDLMVI